MQREDDERCMGLALEAAERGLGTTAPNPSVGAVVVRDGTVVGVGWTQPGGRPHAETEALRMAGEAARGATLYVTLEPCAHHGQTPPCAEAVIAAGIARAVIGAGDPDARVAGRGMALLRAAGVEVVAGVLETEARWLTLGHILRVTAGRPFVQLKMALSAEGGVARGSGGRPVWVTGERARAEGHLLRAKADAILVGRQTVEDDDPELTCRLPGLEARSPARVVLDSFLAIPPASRLVRTAREVPVWLVCAADASREREKELAALGCVVIRTDHAGDRPGVPSILAALAGQGITRLLVEGGPQVWRSFGAARIADEVVMFLADGAGRTGQAREQGRLHLRRFLGHDAFALAATRGLGPDLLLSFRSKAHTPGS